MHEWYEIFDLDKGQHLSKHSQMLRSNGADFRWTFKIQSLNILVYVKCFVWKKANGLFVAEQIRTLGFMQPRGSKMKCYDME